MTPLAGRTLAVALLLLFGLGLVAPASAQGDNSTTSGNATADYAFTVHATPGKATWVETKLSFPAASKVVLVYNSTKAALPHDIQICTVAATPASCGTSGAGRITGTAKSILSDKPAAATPVFTMPKEGLKYVCSVHPDTMVGTLSVGAPGGGGGAGDSITQVGVHYLAYWVGVISFALLFVVYGASFFVFKHGETSESTDQKDRPGFEDKRIIAGLPEYAWVLLGLLVIAAGVVIFFQIMLSGF